MAMIVSLSGLHLETSQKVIGIVASAFTALKSLYDYALSRSLARQQSKTIAGIDTSLTRIRRASAED